MSTSRPQVLIAGGGVAALEALIALHELAGDHLEATLLAPEPDFVYRPMAVAEPFCLGHAAHHPLGPIAAELGARLVREALAEVRTGARQVTGSGGSTLDYDALLVAVGARAQTVYRHAITFGEEGAPEALAELIADLERGAARRVAFVVPSGVVWSLPLYELAVMTARHAWSAGIDDVELYLVTPEERPLELFGAEASGLVAELLAQERVEFIGAASPDLEEGAVVAGGRRLEPVRAITLPVLTGPRIPGLPCDDDGFLPVDRHSRVVGTEDVYAAGDATDFPVKQGGLAAQQAVAAAEAIAAGPGGADLRPQPFRPVLRGMLLTGGQSRWLSGAGGDSSASLHPLWWPPTKIASRYLAPFLLGREDARLLEHPPARGHPVARTLEHLIPHETSGS